MKYGDKHLKRAKWETYTVGHGIWQETMKNVKYEKYTLYNMNCGEKTAKCGKWDTNTVWPGIWRETLKKREKWEMHTVGPGIGREK